MKNLNKIFGFLVVITMVGACSYNESRTASKDNTYIIFDRFKIIRNTDDPNSGHPLIYDYGKGSSKILQQSCKEVYHTHDQAYLKCVESNNTFEFLKLELKSPSKGSLDAIYDSFDISESEYKIITDTCKCNKYVVPW